LSDAHFRFVQPLLPPDPELLAPALLDPALLDPALLEPAPEPALLEPAPKPALLEPARTEAEPPTLALGTPPLLLPPFSSSSRTV